MPSIEFIRSTGSLILRLVLRLLNIDLADFKSILLVTKVIFVTNSRDVPELFEIIFDKFVESVFFEDHFHTSEMLKKQLIRLELDPRLIFYRNIKPFNKLFLRQQQKQDKSSK